MSDKPALIIGPDSDFFRTDPALELRLAKVSPPPDGFRVDLLPIRPDLLALAHQAQSQGRAVYLAADLPADMIAPAADHFGMEIIPKDESSESRFNLRFGPGNWELAKAPALARPGLRALLKPMRPHQWVKNILLFLPILAAHAFTWEALSLALLGFVAFSAAASSIYIVNDLLDLEADRLHATKKNRPFASGLVPLQTGLWEFAGLALMALGIAAFLGPVFAVVIVIYMVTSLLYSFRLKRMRWLDIGILAALYTLRVIGGAAAAQVDTTIALLLFVFPVFLSLGAVKRLTEVTLATSDARLPGRGYARKDRTELLYVAIGAVIAALLAYFFYTISAHAERRYPDQSLLQLALLPIAWWMIRMVRLGYHGQMDHDPIVFALRDRRGLGLIMFALSLMFWAAGLWQKWFGF
jgi:4-hydroxybenzoate polyprenyltransferase